jgi:hypothetical protein
MQVTNSRFPPTYAVTPPRKGTDSGDGGVGIFKPIPRGIGRQIPAASVGLAITIAIEGAHLVERGKWSQQDSQVRPGKKGKE